jgi:hypothetical protein
LLFVRFLVEFNASSIPPAPEYHRDTDFLILPLLSSDLIRNGNSATFSTTCLFDSEDVSDLSSVVSLTSSGSFGSSVLYPVISLISPSL